MLQADAVDLALHQQLLAMRDSGQLQSLRMPPGWEQLPHCDSLSALLAQPLPRSSVSFTLVGHVHGPCRQLGSRAAQRRSTG